MSSNTVKLRGHHFLCMLSYRGVGYTPPFVENFDRVLKNVNQGFPIEIVTGVDDICHVLQIDANPCQHAETCRSASVLKRDETALASIKQILESEQLVAGSSIHLDPNDIEKLRAAFRAGSIRTACLGCEWYDFCSEIADQNFAGAKLFPAP